MISTTVTIISTIVTIISTIISLILWNDSKKRNFEYIRTLGQYSELKRIMKKNKSFDDKEKMRKLTKISEDILLFLETNNEIPYSVLKKRFHLSNGKLISNLNLLVMADYLKISEKDGVTIISLF